MVLQSFTSNGEIQAWRNLSPLTIAKNPCPVKRFSSKNKIHAS